VHGLTDEQRGRAGLRCSRPTVDTLLVEFSGSWRLQDEFPALTDVEQSLDDTPRVQRITFDTTGLTAWDSGLLTFLLELIACGARRQIVVDQEGLPSGLKRLLHLATAVPERQGARREATQEPFLSRIGHETLALVASVGDLLGFIGEAILALMKLFRGQARFRPVELIVLIQECGAQALPIVTLICFLGPEVKALMQRMSATAQVAERSVQSVGEQTGPVAAQLKVTLEAATALLRDSQQLLRRVDAQVAPMSDGIQKTLEAFRTTMKDSDQLIRHVDARVTPMVDNLMETSTRLRATRVRMQQVMDGDVVRVLQDTNRTLQEFSGAARSVRVLADYLERNPDSVLYGKSGSRR
jgi:hypothetical protein